MAEVAELEIRVRDMGLEAADRNLRRIESSFSKTGASVVTFNQALDLTRRIMAGARTAFDAVVGPAIAFESAFAGVRKTVNATEAELAKLSVGLRALDLQLPVATANIVGVAEAAGQLGIKTEAIEGFTRTMVELGLSTNLSAEEAATALARLANITQLPQTEFDRLGSTIVALGNNMATTEREIVDMSLRIAGAGQAVGLTEGQILAFASTLSSVGIEAEAGGTAISRIFIEIAKSVETGDKRLALFARTAGLSTREFAQAFRSDAATATQAFVEGLGAIQEEGGSTIQVLDALALEDIRVAAALRGLASSGDLLGRALSIQSQAWEENIALSREAAQRVKTTESQMELLRKSVNDLARDIGTDLLPVVRDVVDGTRNWIAVNKDLTASRVVDWVLLLKDAVLSLQSIGDIPVIAQLQHLNLDVVKFLLTQLADLPKSIEQVRDTLRPSLEALGDPAVVTIGNELVLTTGNIADNYHRLADAVRDFQGRKLSTEQEHQLFIQAEQTTDAYLRLRAAQDAVSGTPSVLPQLPEPGPRPPDLDNPLGLTDPFFRSSAPRRRRVVTDSEPPIPESPEGGSTIDPLRDFADSVIEETQTAFEAFSAFKTRLDDAFARGFINADQYQRALAQATFELQHGTEAAREMEAALKANLQAGIALFEETRTPAEKLATEIERINRLYESGALQGGEDTRARAIENLTDAYRAQAQQLRDSVRPAEALARELERIDALARDPNLSGVLTADVVVDLKRKIEDDFNGVNDQFDDLLDATRGFGNDFSQTIAEGLAQGKFEFDQFFQSLLTDINRLVIQKTFTDPLLKFVEDGILNPLTGKGAKGGDDTLTGLAGGFFGGVRDAFSGREQGPEFVGPPEPVEPIFAGLESAATSFGNTLLETASTTQQGFFDLIGSIGSFATDLFSSLFGSGGAFDVGEFFGAVLGGAAKGAAGGATAHDGALMGLAPRYHSGGLAQVLAAQAEMARYHGGGLAGLRAGEVPAILEEGEWVIPKGLTRELMATMQQGPKVRRYHEGGVVAPMDLPMPDLRPTDSGGRTGTSRDGGGVTIRQTIAPVFNLASIDPRSHQQLLTEQYPTIKKMIASAAREGGEVAKAYRLRGN